MKILILGAAGQIAVKLTDLLLEETDITLVLYARHGEQRASNPRLSAGRLRAHTADAIHGERHDRI